MESDDEKIILLVILLALVPSGCASKDAGPETIDLKDPILYVRNADSSYKLNMEIKSDGVDLSGNPKSFILSYDIKSQAAPKAQHISMEGEGASGTVELVILGDQVMSVNPSASCSIFPVSSMQGQSPEDTIPRIDTLLTGQAKRIETGVKIEGITTDQYQITTTNMTNPQSSATPRVTEGSVYVARDGGYIVRVELNGLLNSSQSGFDPNVESQMRLIYTFIPVKAGSLDINPPAECQEQLSGGGDAYPMMEGVTDLVYAQDELFYNANASIDEALNFYHARMIEKGWSLTNESRSETASTATLEFLKGNAGVVVSIVAQGESVSVTINKK